MLYQTELLPGYPRRRDLNPRPSVCCDNPTTAARFKIYKSEQFIGIGCFYAAKPICLPRLKNGGESWIRTNIHGLKRTIILQAIRLTKNLFAPKKIDEQFFAARSASIQDNLTTATRLILL